MKHKIAFIIYDLRGGGVERVLLNIKYYSTKKNNKNILIDIISIFGRNDYKKQYNDAFISKIQYINIDNISYLQKIIFTPFILLKLAIFCITNNYDSYILCEPITWFLELFIKYFLNKKVILLLQTPRINYLFHQQILLKIAYTFLFLNIYYCDSIICPSFGIKFDLSNNYKINPSKIIVIPNCLFIVKKDKRLYFEIDSNKTILSIGRLIKQKNHAFLIKSFYRVIQVFPDARLIILGEGSEENNLRQLISHYKMNEVIKIFPFSNPENYYKKSGLFVLSSNYEGFSNVIIEAMSYGLPIISTDCDYGPKEILSDRPISYPYKKTLSIRHEKFGILVKSQANKNDSIAIKSLSKSIILLIKDMKIRTHYSKMSLSRSKDYSIKKIFGQYQQFLTK